MPEIDRRHLLATAPLATAAATLAGIALTSGPASAATAGSITLIEPDRFLDSRRDEPGKYGPNADDNVLVPGLLGHEGALINVTITETEGSGFFRIAGVRISPPPTSTINWWGAGQILSNLAVVRSSNGGINILSGGPGRAHLVLDLLGYIG